MLLTEGRLLHEDKNALSGYMRPASRPPWLVRPDGALRRRRMPLDAGEYQVSQWPRADSASPRGRRRRFTRDCHHYATWRFSRESPRELSISGH